MVKRIDVLGAPLDCVDMVAALEQVEVMLQGQSFNMIIALNPEKVIKSQQDPRLLSWLNNAGLVIPDGIGVVVASRLLNNVEIERVPGSELMPAICERAAQRAYKLFLYGASPQTIEKTVEELNCQYPGIQIVGYQHGYLAKEQMPELVDRINQSQANILFVALGSPQQELWMDENAAKLENIRVCQGVGGTFDVIAGTVKRAPQFFIKIHCEWLYRLLSQPKRLLRQTALPLFAYKLLLAYVVEKLKKDPGYP